MAASKGPGLYEFLIEAELQHYYAGFKNDLKVKNVPQLKYVTEDDLLSIGMSKPEMRRLKKFFQRYFPQNYLSKFKKLILSKKEDNHEAVLSVANEPPEKPAIKVPNKHIIPAEAIVVNKELGEGEFGTVQQGVWTDEEDRIQVAIKCLSRERMQNNPIEFLKEAAIMHGIDHEHIVRLYGVVLDTNSLMLVTELAPLRSLLECLKEPSLRSNFPVLSLCDFSIQICDGMQYLEQKRLIHRDLAARNILVFSKNKVKISDFGLSRALGVGKDYYQTKFNVNLKLPIAWCAPECISYLKFTSASDVWAYGVTLWEMFSYGFQPWAALTGHQIWEAIDEPNFQRLEQPECCPREYYNVMMKCWQHDPNARPRFSDLITLLPECKPEQVQAVQDFIEDPMKSKREQLVYRKGDIITVLDKQQQTGCWKGVVNSGKTGWFNPANTVAYLGNNLPSNNVSFSRGDGKNTYSSKRRIRPDMISGPQGDFKHTGHVGLDGAYFGDLSFLGGKTPNLPRQIVTPYRPHEDTTSIGTDSNQIELSRTSSDVSDCTPLLKTLQTESNWAEANKSGADHEYHEISDDEELAGSPIFKNNGPSLMDEMEFVFRSFGTSQTPPPPAERKKPPPLFVLPQGASISTPPASPLAEAINVKNELKEMAAKAAGRKKQATVKPISAADEKALDSAIAMANELTAKSMSDLDGCTPPESPHTPASPSKRKFSFRFPSVQKHASPKVERKNFAEQAACIRDIQALCDKLRLKSLSPTPTPPPSPRFSSIRGSYSSLSRDSSPQGSPQRRFQGLGSTSELSKNPFHRNGFGPRGPREEKPLKLPPWDQASAEFYFARSRDLLTKIIPTSPQKNDRLFSHEQSPRTSQYYENWPAQESNGRLHNSSRPANLKPWTNPSPPFKEVPLTDKSNFRKSLSKGHLRRRSYTDRCATSTSSDSSDSDGGKQMSYRMKMRRQRRGGSFSHSLNHTPKGSQTLLSSPPPQNSFLNSVVSPKISPVSKNKFYFTNFKGLSNDGVQHSSLNNLCRQNYVFLSGFDMKWPEKVPDSSSLTFTSSNSSTLNWEEYPEFDKDFLSFNNCPPSPAPQSSISPEAKEVYSSLVEQPVVEAQSIIPASTISKLNPQQQRHSVPENSEANPLRMLRSGAFPIVRPKTRTGKCEKPVRVPTSLPVPPNQLVVEESSQGDDERWRKDSGSSQTSKDGTAALQPEEENPIPLPPRDRSRPSVSNKQRHHRKHPLVIPGLDQALLAEEQNEPLHISDSSPTTPLEPPMLPQYPTQQFPFKTCDIDHSFDDQIATELDALDDINVEHTEELAATEEVGLNKAEPELVMKPEERKTNPSLHLKQKIAKLNQQALRYATEDTTDGGAFRKFSSGSMNGAVAEEEPEAAMRRHDDHVSCEDLLEFSAKSKSKSRGEDSDEVRLMSKVLGREMTSENCLIALNATDWDVYSAIKLAKLQNIMKNSGNFYNVTSCWDALTACDGDIAKAASILISQGSGPDYV